MSRELEQQEHPSVKDLCDGYGPEKGWCGDPGHPYVGDCPCREEHEAYERGKRDAEARIVAWLREMSECSRKSAERDTNPDRWNTLHLAANQIEKGAHR